MNRPDLHESFGALVMTGVLIVLVVIVRQLESIRSILYAISQERMVGF